LNRLSHSKRVAAAAAIASVLVVALSVAIAQAATTKKVTLKSQAVSSLNANVLAAPTGRTLYRLKPETTRHVLCTTQCLQFWKALTVKSKSTTVKLPTGIRGKISFLSRGKNKFQVALKGWPLYTFVGDTAKGQGNGQNIKTFGGTWLTLTVKKSTANTPPTMTNPNPYGY
jgi:predicted lipoprotein with Yx(FWY)xxD motif